MNTSLLIAISPKFELKSQTLFKQGGCFYIGTTNTLSSLEKRLNEGWKNGKEDLRPFYTSPPLGLCTDWKIVKTYKLLAPFKPHNHPDLHAAFDIPLLSRIIEKTLFEIDNARFPELNGLRLPKNGLEQVFCLKQNDWNAVLAADAESEANDEEREGDSDDDEANAVCCKSDALRMHVSVPLIIDKVTGVLKTNKCI